MVIFKISNLIQPDGNADYKGLDLSTIIPGSQVYPLNENVAYLKTNGGAIPDHPDITIITEADYIAAVEADKANRPKPPEQEIGELKQRQELMQAALDELILGGAL